MDHDREEMCVPQPIPANIASLVDGYAWARDTVGESGGTVYRLHGKSDAPDLFLKHGQGVFADDVIGEMARLRWLAGHIAVPAIVQFVATPDGAWLLMSAMPGKTAYQLMSDQAGSGNAVVDALADFLRRLHAIPVAACPFTSAHAHRLHLARARIDAGLVDADDFDDERAGWSAEQVWDAMQDLLPLAPDLVVTHGDYSLDNVFIVDGKVSGCIDAGRVGIADRYQDLAIAWNCLSEFGPALQKRFLQQYGVTQPDQARLAFHLMLDELF
ncbi:APH(3')-I family aminoglycoside O-phosphotransferase [Massilia sp. CF038]|uniref:APH(3')-I family aminoglycoside O-phosphotransferase n=1 Tax=Massilia sp. CF038 TaxID=1881045 RepID=UPI000911488A|nr:APH(3')-I family aminoglycoside O-phosphotransferase [Massilia sp. CF038]SHH45307.1 aminoglycoside 3'-phosphotransferase-1 [Massilia sp. CF038]